MEAMRTAHDALRQAARARRADTQPEPLSSRYSVLFRIVLSCDPESTAGLLLASAPREVRLLVDAEITEGAVAGVLWLDASSATSAAEQAAASLGAWLEQAGVESGQMLDSMFEAIPQPPEAD